MSHLKGPMKSERGRKKSTVSNLYGTGRICALIESSLTLAWVEVTLQITGGASGGKGPQLVMEGEKNCMGEESLESAHTNVWPLSVSAQKRLWLKNKLRFMLRARCTKCRQSASQLCHQSSSVWDSSRRPAGTLATPAQSAHQCGVQAEQLTVHSPLSVWIGAV